MPSRNVLKIDSPDSYYHVYARGASKSTIFFDQDDYVYFLSLFKRYLSKKRKANKLRVPYPHLYNKLELLCFCLMPNHFHMLVYQKEVGSMQLLMRGVMTSYSRYFNTKYNRTGSLYESRYKASMITNQSYLDHISRYIHLNPNKWQFYPYSSMRYYSGEASAEWLLPDRILNLFKSTDDYLDFVSDYKSNNEASGYLQFELANIITQ